MPTVHPRKRPALDLPSFDVTVTEDVTTEEHYTEKDHYRVGKNRRVEALLTTEDGTALLLSVTVQHRVRQWRSPRGRGSGSYTMTQSEYDAQPRIYSSSTDGVQSLFRRVEFPQVGDFPHLDLRGYDRQEDGTFREMRDEPSIYTHRGDFPEVDAAFDAANGEHVAIEKAFTMLALGEVDTPLRAVEDPALKWKNTAGCSCPCSPGFVATGYKIKTLPPKRYSWETRTASYVPDREHFDVWVSVTTVSEALENERRQIEAAAERATKQAEEARKAAARAVKEAEAALAKAQEDLARLREGTVSV